MNSTDSEQEDLEDVEEDTMSVTSSSIVKTFILC